MTTTFKPIKYSISYFIFQLNIFLKKFRSIENTVFVTGVSLLAFFSLWFFNFSNKEMVVLFFVLFILLLVYSRNIGLSLFITYLISSTIFVGKTHYYQLLDLKEFPHLKELYPFGIGTLLIIKPSDIFSFGISIYALINLLKIKAKLHLEKIDFFLILFLLWTLMVNIVVSPRIMISLYYTLDLFQAVSLHFFLKLFKNKQKSLSIIPLVFFVIAIFQSYISIHQFIKSGPLQKNVELVHLAPKFGGVIDETYFTFRPIGTFLHSNNLGVYLSALTLFLFSFYLIYTRWSYLLSLVLAFTSIILSLSRTAWISLFIGTLYFFYSIEHSLKINLLQKFKTKFLLLTIVFIPLLIYSLPRISKTALTFNESGGGYLRLKQTQEILNLIKSSPFFGTGSGMSTLKAIELNKKGVFVNFPDQIHNHYLLILAENGSIGLFLFVCVLFFYFRGLTTKLKKTKIVNGKILIYGLIASSLAIVLSAFSQPFFYYSLLIIFYHLKDIA